MSLPAWRAGLEVRGWLLPVRRLLRWLLTSFRLGLLRSVEALEVLRLGGLVRLLCRIIWVVGVNGFSSRLRLIS
jgi:hypothetical protein